jgi:biopolymer transport protein ExbD
MNPLTVNHVARPNRGMRSLTLLIFLTTLFVAAISGGQVMQKGVSVKMPVTNSAVPMPDVDMQDSLIVAVTDNGGVFFGITPTTPEALTERLRSRLTGEMKNDVYIKADARARYTNVVKVLDAIRAAGVKEPVVLTAQQELAPASTPVPPEGLQVSLESPASGSEPMVVQVLDSGRQWPTLKVSNEIVAWDTLQQNVKQLILNSGGKVVLLQADGILPFAHVAHVIDICRSTGVKVVLAVPAL